MKTDVKNVLVIFSLLILFGSSATGLPAEKLSVRTRVGFDHFGPIRVGMSVEEAARASGRRIIEEPRTIGDKEYHKCHYATISGLDGVDLMIIKGKVARFDISAPSISTIAGAQVGQTETEIKRIYSSQVTVTGHPYLANGHYLIIKSKLNKCQLIFETDEGVVTSYRAGRLPEVESIEGCS